MVTAGQKQQALIRKTDDAIDALVIAERDHKNALKELAQEREEHRDPVVARRKIKARLVRVASVVGGLLLALTAIGGMKSG